ncbi:MAG TPA: hypothetical protein VJ353_16835, partial [Xanthobacteraceae bacterium]|nr:hypothetical protein [Xanthobacteraceae bacterium]
MTNRAIDSTRSRAQLRAGMATGIKLTRSIAYAEHSRHRLDVCRPAAAVAAPVVVFFYGGAWRSGNKG